MNRNNKTRDQRRKFNALVRLLIESIVKFLCIVLILWICGANYDLPIWRYIIAGFSLGVFTNVEKRQWKRTSNDLK